MADKEINDLTDGGAVVAGDLAHVVRSGNSRKVALKAQLPATPASASGPASIEFAEDTDNGSNKVTVQAPAALAGDVTVTLPSAAGTLALTSDIVYPPGFLFGGTLSNNTTDATNDIDFAAVKCRDATDAANISIGTGQTKQLDATYAAGTNAGGRFDASISDGTWYAFAISDGTNVGFGFSKSLDPTAAPNYPGAGYKYRRLGAIIRASGAIVGFTQKGDEFLLKAPVKDINVSAGLGTTAINYTLSVPSGIKVTAIMAASGVNGVGTWGILLSSPDQTDTAAVYLGPATLSGPVNVIASGTALVRTNTSAQIRARASRASTDLYETTMGWIDDRDRV